MTTIQRILKWSGQWYRVSLACGHHLEIRGAELKEQQLYIGREIECAQCAEERL